MLHDVLKLGSRLLIFSLLAGALLGFVNAVTEGPIQEQDRLKTASAIGRVLPGIEREPEELSGEFGDDAVLSVWECIGDFGLIGHVVKVRVSGYGGEMQIVVGVGANGSVTGLEVLSHSETAGLGAKAAAAGFGDRFAGYRVEPGQSFSIQAISGATITTNAVMSAADIALREAARLRGR